MTRFCLGLTLVAAALAVAQRLGSHSEIAHALVGLSGCTVVLAVVRAELWLEERFG